MTDDIKQKTRETAKKLFAGGIKIDPPYRTWKEFDRDLANDFSCFITIRIMTMRRSSRCSPGRASW